jgi:hypothetical protein
MKTTLAFLPVVGALLLHPVVVQAQQPEPAGSAASAPATTSAKRTTLEPAFPLSTAVAAPADPLPLAKAIQAIPGPRDQPAARERINALVQAFYESQTGVYDKATEMAGVGFLEIRKSSYGNSGGMLMYAREIIRFDNRGGTQAQPVYKNATYAHEAFGRLVDERLLDTGELALGGVVTTHSSSELVGLSASDCTCM